MAGIRWLLPAASLLCLALPCLGQDLASPDASLAPRIEVLWAAGSPVTVASTRLGTEDGLPFVECVFLNDTDASAWQVDLLFLVYDSVGRRKAAHAVSVAPADLPIEPRSRRAARIVLPYVDARPDDTVRVGLTKVGTNAAPGAWANEKLGDESDAQMDALFAPPSLVVSAPEGAPVAISDVTVQADTDGRVLGVSLTASSAGEAPVLGFTVVAHVFDDAGRIRRSLYQTVAPGRPLLPGLPYPMRLRIDAADLAQAKVWVGVESSKTPAWTNGVATLEQAKAAMERRRR
jgi:hypothetical protein